MRYILDFGSALAGGAPSFLLFKRTDTLANLPAPDIIEVGSGLYSFDWEWTADVQSITYKAMLGGIELADVITPDALILTVSAYSTAGEIINRVATEVGLDELADPYTSQDPNFVQLRRLFQSVGGELLNARPPWPQLISTYTLTTIAGQTDYPLPTDFRGMINETGWDSTRRLPLAGPATPIQWRRQIVWGGTDYTLTYRLTPQVLRLYPAPAAGIQVSLEYVSSLWVQSQSANSPDKTTPTASSDRILFDDLLAVRALKLKYLQAKGFDTTVAAREYGDALEAAKGRAGGAPRLNLNGSRRPTAPVADGGNGILYH